MSGEKAGTYNLQIVLPGAAALTGPSATATLDVFDPQEPASIEKSLASAGVSPADLRSRSVLVVGDDATAACIAYAAVIGLAGRYLDVSDGSHIVQASQVAAAGRRWKSAGRPTSPIAEAQIGAEHPDLIAVGVGAALTPPEVTVVSYCRKLRLVPPQDPLVAVTQLIAVAAIRQRGLDERLPQLVSGSEPAGGDPGIRLDDIRRIGQNLRRMLDIPERNELAEARPPSERDVLLQAAAEIDIAEVMGRLGARKNEDTGLWHCPRPERHTNGDATASMKLTASGVRCFRCDGERVDSLRLTIDTLGCTPDEAAVWLTSGAERPVGRV